jgi:DNA (cytosine-5)-methyltransferase 1
MRIMGGWMDRKLYRFADLFSGCGGLSLGLSLAGMRGQFAIERDPMAFETFSHNFLAPKGQVGFDWPSWLAREAWDIEDLLTSHKRDLEGLRGTIDVLAGGPPCQGFSFAGRRVEDDPRNLLFKRYVDVVDALRPKVLMLENVPGMRVLHVQANVIPIHPPKETAPKRQSFYEKLVESLDAIGYRLDAQLMDASRFGVPQKRVRLIAVGVRHDLLSGLPGGVQRAFELIENARLGQLASLGLGEATSAGDAISDLQVGPGGLVACPDAGSSRFLEVAYGGPRTPYQRMMNHGLSGRMDSMRLARHRDDIKERFARILAECRKGVRMDDESRKNFALKKHRIYPMAIDEPAPTITTLPDDILHYGEPRILTVRESARLQSFPDWFEFRGKYTTGGDRRTRECPRYSQVGNAVPPYLARAVGLGLSALLDEIAVAHAFSDNIGTKRSAIA